MPAIEEQVIAPTPAVVPVEAPAPAQTPSQQYDEAVNTRDPKKALQVAAAHSDSPVGLAAIRAADIMLKGERDFQGMVGPIEKAGGLATPEGRIVAAEQSKKVFSQAEPRFRDALVYWLSGNKKMAQAMVTGGTTAANIVTDNNGELIKVTKNQLGDIVDAEDMRGNKLTKDEYAKRYVGRQKYEDTLGFIGQKQQQEANLKAFQETTAKTNAYATVAPELERLYTQLHDDADYLRQNNADFDPQELAKVMGYGTKALGAASNVASSQTAFDQATKDRSAKIGQTITDKEAATLNAGPKFIGGTYTADGLVSKDGTESISYGALKQKTSSSSASKDLTENLSQTREQLIASEKFKKLSGPAQERLLRLLETSHTLGQTQLRMQQEYGSLPYIIMPSGVEISDQMGLVQAKAIQGLLSAKAAQLYPKYERQALAQSGGIIPAPNELLRGFTDTPTYRSLLTNARVATDAILSKPQPPAAAPAAPASPAATGAAPPPAAPATPAVQGRPAGSRPAPRLPAGIPEGSVRTNRVTRTGQPLWRSPDGKLHTED